MYTSSPWDPLFLYRGYSHISHSSLLLNKNLSPYVCTFPVPWFLNEFSYWLFLHRFDLSLSLSSPQCLVLLLQRSSPCFFVFYGVRFFYSCPFIGAHSYFGLLLFKVTVGIHLVNGVNPVFGLTSPNSLLNCE